ncbi:alpha/beta fold hydrolase [Stenoxybacter acetivorans]|uniref:alpha/beta fold hydrolase n=1 Tax=Stenoxybacter acetivorans TaxID=422441 RepID=UPI00068B626D|nr:alpha/beta hydrolase [Stenoxybacter acetivorans]
MTSVHFSAVRQPESLFFNINGLRLHTVHWQGNGQINVLLLHGWMDCAHNFQLLADALPLEWNVYAPDWRGCGLSEHQTHGHYDRGMMLADLAQIIDIISPDSPMPILGHSLGGMLAAHYAAAFPERVQNLILAEAFGLNDGDLNDVALRLRRFIQAVSKPKSWHDLGSLEAVAQKYQSRNPLLSMAQARFFAEQLTMRSVSGSLIYKADIKHTIAQPVPYRLALAYAQWQQIRVPILWVEGGLLPHNFYLRQIQDSLDTRYQALGNPLRVRLAQSGHMLHWEAPQELAEAAAAFWRQQNH